MTIFRPRLMTGLATVAVAAIGGFTSLPQLVRPVEASAVPIIEIATPAPQPQVSMVAAREPVDCAAVACLALTFDDGPRSQLTPRILDILDSHKASATFFVTGTHVSGNEALLRRMHASGHEIGNHTWGHAKLTEMAPQEIQDDIARTQQAIAATGVPAPSIFRPPYGLFNPVVRTHVPMSVVFWNVDPRDWEAKSPQQITDFVTANAKPGAVVLLHDIHQVTADALEPMLVALKQQYHFVTVSQLLDIPPGQQGVFYSR